MKDSMKFLVLALMPVLAAGSIPGGITPTTVDPSSEPVVFAVQEVNKYLGSLCGGSHPNHSLVEVVDARSQVVAGQLLYLTLRLTEDYFCNVTVWYRAWLHGRERLQVTNGPTCHKRHTVITGGISAPKPVPQTATSEDETSILNVLKVAACVYNDAAQLKFASTVGSTTGATYTTQVTSGVTYRFSNVTMLPTECRNQGCILNGDLSKCIIDVRGTRASCNFTVQFQPWMIPPIRALNQACVP